MAMAQQGNGNGEPTEVAAEYLMTIRYMHGEGQPVIAARLAERLRVSAATVRYQHTTTSSSLKRSETLNVVVFTR